MERMRQEIDRLWSALEEEREQRRREVAEVRAALEAVQRQEDIALPVGAGAVGGPSTMTGLLTGDAQRSVEYLPPLSPTSAVLTGVSTSPFVTTLLEAGAGDPMRDHLSPLAVDLVETDTTDLLSELLGVEAHEFEEFSNMELQDEKPREETPADGSPEEAVVGEADGVSGDSPEAGRAEAVLLIGDSILHRTDVRCDPPRSLTIRAIPGYTLRRWVAEGVMEVRRWLDGLHPDTSSAQIILWVGGNDVYPKDAIKLPEGMKTRLMNEVQDRIGEIQRMGVHVTLVGTQPRLSRDRGRQWEETQAYELEKSLRQIKKATGAAVIPLGRRLCCRHGKQRVYKVAEGFHLADGVHLNKKGYGCISLSFPKWLRMR